MIYCPVTGWILVADPAPLCMARCREVKFSVENRQVYQLFEPSQRSRAINTLPTGWMGKRRHRAVYEGLGNKYSGYEVGLPGPLALSSRPDTWCVFPQDTQSSATTQSTF